MFSERAYWQEAELSGMGEVRTKDEMRKKIIQSDGLLRALPAFMFSSMAF